jgi:hypothetical protein
VLIDDMTSSPGLTEKSKARLREPLAVVTASRSARPGLHAANAGTSSHL